MNKIETHFIIGSLELIVDFLKDSLSGYKNYIAKHIIRNLPDDFPWLISFPRTGSHWVRMALEKYTNRPNLPRAFYSHPNNDYLLAHSHDNMLTLKKSNVIYLYRENPVDVVYSQISYHNQSLKDSNIVHFWSNQYRAHLKHWLSEDHSRKKVLISYDKMILSPLSEFSKLCAHLNLRIDAELINKVFNSLSKNEVKQRTQNDSKVVDLSSSYHEFRDAFEKDFKEVISNIVQLDTIIKS